MSRNVNRILGTGNEQVTPREGRVSRNQLINSRKEILDGHAPRGACE